VQIVAALMAIDAGLERLRHAVLEKERTMIVKFHPAARRWRRAGGLSAG
jgi:hypothetical protein